MTPERVWDSESTRLISISSCRKTLHAQNGFAMTSFFHVTSAAESGVLAPFDSSPFQGSEQESCTVPLNAD